MFEYIKIELALILIITVAFILGRVLQDHRETARLAYFPIAKIPEDRETSKIQDRDDSAGHGNVSRRSSARFLHDIDSVFDDAECDANDLAEVISNMCAKNYDAASALFYKGRETAVLTSSACSVSMFLSLCSACIRVGSPHFIFKYFAEMDALGISRDLSFYNSLVKILTFKKQYKINLSLHDAELNLVVPRSFENPESIEFVKSMFSCFLYSAVETREFWRAPKFFRLIEKTGIPPSENDYSNVTRAMLEKEDWMGAASILARSSPETNRRAIQMFTDATYQTRLELVCGLVENSRYSETVVEVLLCLKRRGNLRNLLEHVIRSGMVSRPAFEGVARFMKTFNLGDSLVEAAVNKILNHECLTDLVECLNQFLYKHTCPRKLLPLVLSKFSRDLKTTKGVQPNQKTYLWLLKASTGSLNQTMDVYRLLEDHREAGFVLDDSLLCAILDSISSCPVAGGRAWVLAKGVVDDFSMAGIEPETAGCCESLINILVKTASADRSESDACFEECQRLLATTPVSSTDLYVHAVEGAIRTKHPKGVRLLYQAMADAHALARTTQKAHAVYVKASTVDRLLATAVKANAGNIVVLIVELTLLNRLPLAAESVSKLESTPRLEAILKRFQYRATV